jgi:Ca2+-binding EF-hand superfamily protein
MSDRYGSDTDEGERKQDGGEGKSEEKEESISDETRPKRQIQQEPSMNSDDEEELLGDDSGICEARSFWHSQGLRRGAPDPTLVRREDETLHLAFDEAKKVFHLSTDGGGVRGIDGRTKDELIKREVRKEEAQRAEARKRKRVRSTVELMELVTQILGKFDSPEALFVTEFDRDGDGFVSSDELRKALHKMGLTVTNEECFKIMKKIDSNGDGEISYQEFVEFLDPRERKAREERMEIEQFEKLVSKVRRLLKRRANVSHVFDELDSDGSGELDEKEFLEALCLLHLDLTRQEAYQLYQRFDTDGDGKISYKEFVDFVQGNQHVKPNLDADDEHSTDIEGEFGEEDSMAELTRKLRGILKNRKRGDIDRVFDEFDENGDGVLSRSEFGRALVKLDLDVTKSETSQLMRRFDRDEKGVVSVKDFIAFVLEEGGEEDDMAELTRKLRGILKNRKRGDIDRVFDEFDENGDGVLSRSEFGRALRKLDLDVTKSETSQLMRRFDRDDKGVVSVKDFMVFVLGPDAGKGGDDSSVASSEAIPLTIIELTRKLRGILKNRKRGDIDRVFDEFDENGDGVLSQSEFGRALVKLGLENASAEVDLDKLFNLFDCDDKGVISVKDFMRFVLGSKNNIVDLTRKLRRILKSRKRGDLDRVFEEFDRNGDGMLEKREFSRALRKLDLDVDDTETDQLMRRFDKEGKGVVSVQDFLFFVLQTGSEEVSKVPTPEEDARLLTALAPKLKRIFCPSQDVKSVFMDVDAHSSGTLSESEFSWVLRTMQEDPEHQLRKIAYKLRRIFKPDLNLTEPICSLQPVLERSVRVYDRVWQSILSSEDVQAVAFMSQVQAKHRQDGNAEPVRLLQACRTLEELLVHASRSQEILKRTFAPLYPDPVTWHARQSTALGLNSDPDSGGFAAEGSLIRNRVSAEDLLGSSAYAEEVQRRRQNAACLSHFLLEFGERRAVNEVFGGQTLGVSAYTNAELSTLHGEMVQRYGRAPEFTMADEAVEEKMFKPLQPLLPWIDACWDPGIKSAKECEECWRAVRGKMRNPYSRPTVDAEFNPREVLNASKLVLQFDSCTRMMKAVGEIEKLVTVRQVRRDFATPSALGYKEVSLIVEVPLYTAAQAVTERLSGLGQVAQQVRKRLKLLHRGDVDAAFDDFDENGDGVLSREEFGKGLLKLDLDLSMAEKDELMRWLDSDDSGQISAKAFIGFVFEAEEEEQQEEAHEGDPVLVVRQLSFSGALPEATVETDGGIHFAEVVLQHFDYVDAKQCEARASFDTLLQSLQQIQPPSFPVTGTLISAKADEAEEDACVLAQALNFVMHALHLPMELLTSEEHQLLCRSFRLQRTSPANVFEYKDAWCARQHTLQQQQYWQQRLPPGSMPDPVQQLHLVSYPRFLRVLAAGGVQEDEAEEPLVAEEKEREEKGADIEIKEDYYPKDHTGGKAPAKAEDKTAGAATGTAGESDAGDTQRLYRMLGVQGGSETKPAETKSVLTGDEAPIIVSWREEKVSMDEYKVNTHFKEYDTLSETRRQKELQLREELSVAEAKMEADRRKQLATGDGRDAEAKKEEKETGANRPSAGIFAEGDKVEADYKGKGKYYPGKISNVLLSGTCYDIAYDDGESERGVEPDKIRPLANQKPSTAVAAGNGKVDTGEMTVEACGGAGKGSPLNSSRLACLSARADMLDGPSFGDSPFTGPQRVALPVMPAFRNPVVVRIDELQAVPMPKPTKGPESDAKKSGRDESADRGSRARAKSFEADDKVEANYKGKGKYYPGKISRARLNGTYDIAYDDGERESGVEGEMIRSRDGGGGRPPLSGSTSRGTSDRSFANSPDASASPRKYVRNDTVELRGKSRQWEEGKVLRARANGLYDVTLKSGVREMAVPPERLRPRAGSITTPVEISGMVMD